MATFPEYERHDALGLADLVRRGEVRPRELVEAAIERIEARDGVLNAVVHRAFSQALAAADRPLPEGPFSGVPFLLKDLGTLARGMPATWGSRFLRDFVPDRDGELVAGFRAAGLILMGKTNTPELGTAFFTEPELFGPTRNPWDPTRSPGGSSGGSAAAVAAGYVPMAHASDGGGSIRVPASACGLFGLKPTRGRTPGGDDREAFWFGLGADLVVSRSVRDTAVALDAVSRPPHPERPFREEVGADPGELRIAVSTEPVCGSSMHPECVRAVEEAAALCEELGHHPEEVRLPVDGEALTRSFLVLVAAGVSQDLAYLSELAGRPPRRGEIEPVNRVLAVVARRFGAAELAAALAHMAEATRRMEGLFEDHDVLLNPTVAEPPIEVGSLQPTPPERAALAVARALPLRLLLDTLLDQLGAKALGPFPTTELFNMTGQPAASIPLHWDAQGLPVGVQVAGPAGGEATLLRLASQLEAARPWFERRPPLS